MWLFVTVLRNGNLFFANKNEKNIFSFANNENSPIKLKIGFGVTRNLPEISVSVHRNHVRYTVPTLNYQTENQCHGLNIIAFEMIRRNRSRNFLVLYLDNFLAVAIFDKIYCFTRLINQKKNQKKTKTSFCCCKMCMVKWLVIVCLWCLWLEFISTRKCPSRRHGFLCTNKMKFVCWCRRSILSRSMYTKILMTHFCNYMSLTTAILWPRFNKTILPVRSFWHFNNPVWS